MRFWWRTDICSSRHGCITFPARPSSPETSSSFERRKKRAVQGLGNCITFNVTLSNDRRRVIIIITSPSPAALRPTAAITTPKDARAVVVVVCCCNKLRATLLKR